MNKLNVYFVRNLKQQKIYLIIIDIIVNLFKDVKITLLAKKILIKNYLLYLKEK